MDPMYVVAATEGTTMPVGDPYDVPAPQRATPDDRHARARRNMVLCAFMCVALVMLLRLPGMTDAVADLFLGVRKLLIAGGLTLLCVMLIKSAVDGSQALSQPRTPAIRCVRQRKMQAVPSRPRVLSRPHMQPLAAGQRILVLAAPPEPLARPHPSPAPSDAASTDDAASEDDDKGGEPDDTEDDAVSESDDEEESMDDDR